MGWVLLTVVLVRWPKNWSKYLIEKWRWVHIACLCPPACGPRYIANCGWDFCLHLTSSHQQTSLSICRQFVSCQRMLWGTYGARTLSQSRRRRVALENPSNKTSVRPSSGLDSLDPSLASSRVTSRPHLSPYPIYIYTVILVAFFFLSAESEWSSNVVPTAYPPPICSSML